MSEVIDLIMNGILNFTGSAELLGIIILFSLVITFSILRMPLLVTIALIIPMGYILMANAWLSMWMWAILLIIGGAVLYWIIKELVGR